MDLSLPYESDQLRRQAQRAIYHEARDHPNVVTLALGQTAIPLLGHTEVLPDDLHGQRIRRNLTLYKRADNDSQSDEIILQRIGPRSHDSHLEMLKQIDIGRSFFDSMLAHSQARRTATERAAATTNANVVVRKRPLRNSARSKAKTISQNDETVSTIEHATPGDAVSREFEQHQADNASNDILEPPARHHLGYWYGHGVKHLTVTPDVRFANSEALDPTLRFMVWLRRFVHRFVHPTLKSTISTDDGGKRHILDTHFRQRLRQRQAQSKWAAEQLPLVAMLCHPLYSACSPFQSYSRPHTDPLDFSPTILLNFGYCRLSLPEYNVRIDLRPGEVILFKAQTHHATEAHPGFSGPETKRWAVSCFFHHRIRFCKPAPLQTRQTILSDPDYIRIHQLLLAIEEEMDNEANK